MYLLLDCINYLSADYENVDDTKLLESTEYQKVIKKRLHFLVVRHNELTRLGTTVCDLAAQLLPPIAIAGILLCLSAMSFAYLGDFFGYWCYFQNFIWCLTTVTTGVLIIKCGQDYEDASETIFPAIYETRWITFNKSNRQTILMILMNSQEPLKMKFTDNVACNYELGMAVIIVKHCCNNVI
ncbi:hypothetical protein MTP99_005008 [Tenebrio molitor]|nr:hypothetical protein MTP99_005008 [Tenebrio molitor]